MRVGHGGLRISHAALSCARGARYSTGASFTISGRPSDVSYMPRTVSSAPSSSGSLASMSIVPTTDRDGPTRPDSRAAVDELIEQLADAPESGRARPPLEPGEIVGVEGDGDSLLGHSMFIRYSLKRDQACKPLEPRTGAPTRHNSPAPGRRCGAMAFGPVSFLGVLCALCALCALCVLCFLCVLCADRAARRPVPRPAPDARRRPWHRHTEPRSRPLRPVRRDRGRRRELPCGFRGRGRAPRGGGRPLRGSRR